MIIYGLLSTEKLKAMPNHKRINNECNAPARTLISIAQTHTPVYVHRTQRSSCVCGFAHRVWVWLVRLDRRIGVATFITINTCVRMLVPNRQEQANNTHTEKKWSAQHH